MKRKKKQHRYVEQAKPAKKAYWAIIAVVVLAGIPFGLGKYMELSMPGPYDSGSYVHSAKHILEGARLGVDEVTMAQPGTLLVNIVGVKLFGYSDVGPKVMQGLMQIVALSLMFYTMRRLFGSTAAVLGVVLAAFYLSAPVISKYGNVKEQFMIATMLVGACCFMLRQAKGPWWLMLTAGAAFVNIYYFKATGMSVAIAMVLYLFIHACLRKISLKELYVEFCLLLGGAVLGLVPLTVFYLQQGALNSFMNTLPFTMVRSAIGILLLCGLAYWVVLRVRQYNIFAHIRHQVRWQFWVFGGGALLTFLAGWMIFFVVRGGAAEGVLFLHDVPMISLPMTLYHEVAGVINKISSITSGSQSYVGLSREARSYADQAKYVFRYYGVLKLPVLLACASILTGVLRLIMRKVRKVNDTDINDRLVFFVAMWWLLDMAFVWVSPRPYEQYYLPLCASAAMSSGYVIWLWSQKKKSSQSKAPWLFSGAFAVLLMVIMAWPVFAGLTHSPYNGSEYTDSSGQISRKRGYVQKLKQAKDHKTNPAAWEVAGRYIRDNSADTDRIYIWGWVPGIYVQAQRLSAYKIASEANMHVIPPRQFYHYIRKMVEEFEADPPKFIVDTRKSHYPNDRPPLELWPHIYAKDKRYGNPIPSTSNVITQYDALYKKLLEEKFDPNQKEYNSLLSTTCWWNLRPWAKAMPDEVLRYEYMGQLRKYVMENYRIVMKDFGSHVVFERIN